jgi:arylsulfatase
MHRSFSLPKTQRWLFALSTVIVLFAIPASVFAAPAVAPGPEKLLLWPDQAPVGDGQYETSQASITVYRPAAEHANGAAAVICPGGGYGRLVTGAEGHGIARWLNQHGIAGVVLEYRMPRGRCLVPLLDAQRALRTVRTRAKQWNIDPIRIGIMGFSAGGHLASTAGTHFDSGDPQASDPIQRVSSRPDFMILIYPVITMGAKTHAGSKVNLLGPDPKPETACLFSNEKQVTKQTPPTFLAHARDDKPVPPDNSRMLFESLKAHKVAAEYLELPSGGHGLNGYQGPMWDAWQTRSLEWLAAQKIIPTRDLSPAPSAKHNLLHGSIRTDAARQKPNVLLVLTDDQGYGDLSCHGNPVLKTPHLDRLHAQSVRFTDFHVAPMCTPTRGQIMTGRDCLHNGAYCVCSGKTFIRPRIPTMPELFAAAGYRTAIFGKWHLGDNYPHRPQDRGFQQAVHHLSWGITSTPDYWNNDYFDDQFRHNGCVKQYPGYCTDVWFNEASQWIKSCHQQKEPFLCYLAINAPHGPFFVPDKYRRPYASLDHDTASFLGMVANIDDNMGRLETILQQTGLRDNTILIFMTDNGGTGGVKLYNAGMRGAKASLYEGGHRVPCFIRWPAGGLRPAGDVAMLTECQDLLPTLLDLCGIPAPKESRFDGTSLVGLLRGQDQPELSQRMLVVQYSGLFNTVPQRGDSAVLWNQWRLVSGRELYNIKVDPGQKREVAAGHPETVEKLRSHYQAWWSRVEPTLGEYVPITLGSDRENPTCLTAIDWLAPKQVVCAQDYDVRQLNEYKAPVTSLPGGRPAVLLNSPWNLMVEQAGDYEFSLRRWPVEANAPITAGLPIYKGVDGDYPAGRALPIVKARLRIGPVDESKMVASGDKAVTFNIRLTAGKATLQTWFYDSNGKELCGAFYVYVCRK